MSEEQLKNKSGEEHSRHHHHHHHHSGSSYSVRHHSHRHRSKKFSLKKLADALSPKSFSTSNHIKRIATSTSSAKDNSFTVTFGRILFILIILGVVCFSMAYIFSNDESSAISKAKDTPSENSQLKVQLVQLEIKLESVEAELAKYKEKYGELEDEQISSQN